jgi:hypothetical protein
VGGGGDAWGMGRGEQQIPQFSACCAAFFVPAANSTNTLRPSCRLTSPVAAALIPPGWSRRICSAARRPAHRLHQPPVPRTLPNASPLAAERVVRAGDQAGGVHGGRPVGIKEAERGVASRAAAGWVSFSFLAWPLQVWACSAWLRGCVSRWVCGSAAAWCAIVAVGAGNVPAYLLVSFSRSCGGRRKTRMQQVLFRQGILSLMLKSM